MRLLVAKVYERVAFARHDFQHKRSRRLIDKNQTVVVETLKVKNYSLARPITDTGWHALVGKLAYKARQEGKHLVKIGPWFSSSKLFLLWSKAGENGADIRLWDCECGAVHDRDIHAAHNIKQQGLLKLKAEEPSISADEGKHKFGISPVAA